MRVDDQRPAAMLIVGYRSALARVALRPGNESVRSLLGCPNAPQCTMRILDDLERDGVVLEDDGVEELLRWHRQRMRRLSYVEREGELLRAKEVLHRTLRSHLAGVASFTELARCAARVPHIETAVAAVELAGCHTTPALWQAVLVCCRNQREPEAALVAFEAMREC
eukprot:Hpha_TRINITY_DN6224_c0_g1::TRINITY_DN6224_c0_g1_i1::g.23627::m.23627